MSTSEMLTVAPAASTNSTRTASAPLIVRFAAPGPAMLSATRIGGNGLASTMVPLTAIVIARPGVAVCSASRSEPGPESAVVVTT